MTTAIDDKHDAYSRPAAQFDGDGNLEVRASAAGNCRRALWYAATGYESTNPPTDESLTLMEAGNALEPVVLRAMERAGRQAADSQNPEAVSVRVGPKLLVTGHPDATGRMPLPPDEAAAEAAAQMFLFEDEAPVGGGSGNTDVALGDEVIVEVKTRGPEAFKRWRALGAERSHPASVAQAAFYALGLFGDVRDVVLATMDTGSRRWDYEVVPAERVERALAAACEWLGVLGAHHALNGPDPETLPERDFSSSSWQCRSCPFLNACLPGMEEADEGAETEGEEVSIEDAQDAVTAYANAQEALKEPERAKRRALDTLKGWMRRQGCGKTTIEGRTVSLVESKRHSVNFRKLNALLDPETRAEIVTENASEYVRVS